MPLFVLRCTECSHTFEKLVFSSKRALPKCPACDGETEKRPTTAAFKFKGAGFHRTDYPSIDQRVGEDAEKRWGVLHERNAKFKTAHKTAQKESGSVVRDDSGKYGVTIPVKET